MKHALLVLVVVALSAGAAAAQDRKPPDDSTRISVPGCARGRTFTVGRTPEHEPIRSAVEPGRRLRLAGKKALMNEIKKHEGSMIEITGLIRKSQLAGPGGVTVGGVRIGGGPPVAGAGSPVYNDPRYNQTVIDVESWRPLAEPCPRR